jgi:hypothetical protein
VVAIPNKASLFLFKEIRFSSILSALGERGEDKSKENPMGNCGLCLKAIGNEPYTTIKKFGTKGDKPEDYFYYHQTCWREVK